MDRKFMENWLDILKDSNKVASLFTNTNFYQETPFLTLCTKPEVENIFFILKKNKIAIKHYFAQLILRKILIRQRNFYIIKKLN